MNDDANAKIKPPIIKIPKNSKQPAKKTKKKSEAKENNET